MNLNITDRQATILGIALTLLYDEIGKSGEGQQMMKDASELHKMIVDLKSSNLEGNIQKYPNVNKVEVISSEGEEFIWDVWDECSKVQISFHDDEKTLKVFLVKEQLK